MLFVGSSDGIVTWSVTRTYFEAWLIFQGFCFWHVFLLLLVLEVFWTACKSAVVASRIAVDIR